MFPNDIDNFLQAEDLTQSDLQSLSAYQLAIESGDFTTAQDILASMANGSAKIMNAGRFNAILSAILEIENFYLGNDGVKKFIDDNILAFSDIALYSQSINYNVGNIASNGSQWFKCIQENGPNSQVVEPLISSNWQEYWELFLNKQSGYMIIDTSEPANIDIGDMWLKLIGVDTDNVIGTWRFDDDIELLLDWANTTFTNVSFTSNSQSFSTIQVSTRGVLKYGSTDVYDEPTWTNEAYKTITISASSDQNLLAFLQTLATKISD